MVMIRKDELQHYGVKGMKWGVRRYQNKDGTLTAKGKQRYSKLNIRDVDAQIQRNYGTNKMRLAGNLAASGVSILGVAASIVTANPTFALTGASFASTIATGTNLASAVKYYKDGHDYVHKYDDKNSTGRISKKEGTSSPKKIAVPKNVKNAKQLSDWMEEMDSRIRDDNDTGLISDAEANRRWNDLTKEYNRAIKRIPD